MLSIFNGAFFTSVKPYFKNVLNLIELLLGYIFYITHSFVKKLNCGNLWIKSLLLTVEQFFFLKFEIMQWKPSSLKVFKISIG